MGTRPLSPVTYERAYTRVAVSVSSFEAAARQATRRFERRGADPRNPALATWEGEGGAVNTYDRAFTKAQ